MEFVEKVLTKWSLLIEPTKNNQEAEQSTIENFHKEFDLLKAQYAKLEESLNAIRYPASDNSQEISNNANLQNPPKQIAQTDQTIVQVKPKIPEKEPENSAGDINIKILEELFFKKLKEEIKPPVQNEPPNKPNKLRVLRTDSPKKSFEQEKLGQNNSETLKQTISSSEYRASAQPLNDRILTEMSSLSTIGSLDNSETTPENIVPGVILAEQRRILDYGTNQRDNAQFPRTDRFLPDDSAKFAAEYQNSFIKKFEDEVKKNFRSLNEMSATNLLPMISTLWKLTADIFIKIRANTTKQSNSENSSKKVEQMPLAKKENSRKLSEITEFIDDKLETMKKVVANLYYSFTLIPMSKREIESAVQRVVELYKALISDLITLKEKEVKLEKGDMSHFVSKMEHILLPAFESMKFNQEYNWSAMASKQKNDLTSVIKFNLLQPDVKKALETLKNLINPHIDGRINEYVCTQDVKCKSDSDMSKLWYFKFFNQLNKSLEGIIRSDQKNDSFSLEINERTNKDKCILMAMYFWMRRANFDNDKAPNAFEDGLAPIKYFSCIFDEAKMDFRIPNLLHSFTKSLDFTLTDKYLEFARHLHAKLVEFISNECSANNSIALCNASMFTNYIRKDINAIREQNKEKPAEVVEVGSEKPKDDKENKQNLTELKVAEDYLF